MADFFDTNNCVWIALILVWAVIYGVGAPVVNWPSSRSSLTSIFDRAWWWWWYQIVFNALGTTIGWAMLYFLLHSKSEEFGVAHVIALLIAFVGITGNLPQVSLRLRTLFPGG